MSLTMTKQEIMDVFRMSREQYEEEYMKPAFELMLEKKDTMIKLLCLTLLVLVLPNGLGGNVKKVCLNL